MFLFPLKVEKGEKRNRAGALGGASADAAGAGRKNAVQSPRCRLIPRAAGSLAAPVAHCF
jgi:hypothetical protein